MKIQLPPEKQLEHEIFCQAIKNIDVQAIHGVLEKLHLMYLQEQTLLNEIVTKDLLKNFSYARLPTVLQRKDM